MPQPTQSIAPLRAILDSAREQIAPSDPRELGEYLAARLADARRAALAAKRMAEHAARGELPPEIEARRLSVIATVNRALAQGGERAWGEAMSALAEASLAERNPMLSAANCLDGWGIDVSALSPRSARALLFPIQAAVAAHPSRVASDFGFDDPIRAEGRERAWMILEARAAAKA